MDIIKKKELEKDLQALEGALDKLDTNAQPVPAKYALAIVGMIHRLLDLVDPLKA